MEALILALFLLAAVLASSIIDQLAPKISLPLVQIALGLAIALLTPDQIRITLDPELFLVLFIAPLLYDEAKNADRAALWKNRKPVLSLAIGLVFATVLVIGFSVNLLIPSIPLAAAFALGAALGPTDAVAVTSLSKTIDMPERQRSLLKGELLLNDASGIVSFQFAIAAVVTGSFSLIDASSKFLMEFVGGLVVGVVVGYAGNLLVRKARDIGLENTTFHVLFEIFIPLMVFLTADALHTSGVIAVVAAGLLNVIAPRSLGPSISRMNIVSSSVWHVLSFVLNGVVFVMLGTQLPKATQRTWEDLSIDNLALVGDVLFITFLLLLVRFVWVTVMEWIHHRSERPGEPFSKADMKSALITTLAGPKGTITLSIMFSIPYYISGSNEATVPFPQRDLIIFLACGVILCTLLISTFVVPMLTPKTERKKMEEDAHRQDVESSMEILRSVIEELTAHQTPENRFATQVVVKSYNERLARIKGRNDIEDEPNVELRVTALGWERDYVQQRLAAGELPEEVAYRYLERLARIERLLRHGAAESTWSPRGLYLRLRSSLRRGMHSVVRELPDMSITEETEQLRELQIHASEYVVEHLVPLLAHDDVPTEDASTLLIEYQHAISSLRATRPSIANMSRTADKVDDVRRLALHLELEHIQTMYEDERLTRAHAKRLRENVILMQMDLEDAV